MKWLNFTHKVLQPSGPTCRTVSDPICWILQPTHTSVVVDPNSGFSLCPEIKCFNLTHTQGDAVLVKLSCSGKKVNMQLLTSRAAVTQVSADSTVRGRPAHKDNRRVDNLRHLLVQEKMNRRKEAAARLQHDEEMKSQQHMLRNKIAVRFALGNTYLSV